MSLANLQNVPTNAAEWAIFSFSNQDLHNRIATSLTTGGNPVRQFILDPISFNDPGVWLRAHQTAHDEYASALGIGNDDLSILDFEDQRQVAEWITIHWSLHQQANQRLGLA